MLHEICLPAPRSSALFELMARLTSIASNVNPVSLVRPQREDVAEPTHLQLVASRKWILISIGSVWAVLAGLSLAGQLYLYAFHGTNTKVPDRLNVDTELTVPNWFQSSLLLACAALLAVAAVVAHRSGGRYLGHWIFLAITFVYLSADEAAAIHELTIIPLHDALGTSGILYYAWVIPAFFVMAIFGLAYLGFLRHLTKTVRRLFICAGIIYVSGALGGDVVGGWWYDRHGEKIDLAYSMMTQVEETLETTGIALLLITVVTHLMRAMPEVSIRLKP